MFRIMAQLHILRLVLRSNVFGKYVLHFKSIEDENTQRKYQIEFQSLNIINKNTSLMKNK